MSGSSNIMRKKCFSDLQNNDDGDNIYNAYPGLPDIVLSTLHVLTSFNLYGNCMRQK